MEGKQTTVLSNMNSIMIIIYNDYKLKSKFKNCSVHLYIQLYSIHIIGLECSLQYPVCVSEKF